MKDLLTQLISGTPLSFDQSRDAFEQIMTGNAAPSQVGALLALIQQHGPTVDEIAGAATVMREKVVSVEVPSGYRAIDTCGTGGDHSGTFNVSTAAAIVAAGAGHAKGVVVAKHGNRSITSKSGSSQVLEALGVNLSCDPPKMGECLEQAGICFCFAPAHHPAMKHAMPIRLELGVRTIFNLLGPLTNPAGARAQVMGVFDENLTAPIATVLGKLGADHAIVVHGKLGTGPDAPGVDEISTFGPTRISVWKQGSQATTTIDPSEFGGTGGDASTLSVDGPEASADLIKAVLAGEKGAPREMVAANAGAALVTGNLAQTLGDGFLLAQQAIDSGAASAALAKLVEVSNA